MQYTMELGSLPAGYAVGSARSGQQVPLVFRDIIANDQGPAFLQRVEGLNVYLPEERNINPASIASLLAIVTRDSRARVYIDEPAIEIAMRPTRAVEAGQPVRISDILDIRRLRFRGISIPEDAGFACLLSCRWRKVLYFDYQPLHQFDGAWLPNRTYDVEVALGEALSYVMFQNLFQLSDEDWTRLIQGGWFPFRTLMPDTIRKMIAHAREGWDVDELLPEILEQVGSRVEVVRGLVQRLDALADHVAVIETGLDRFIEQDYVSACSVLYPRIEGVLRSFHGALGLSSSRRQDGLAAVVRAGDERVFDPLLPLRFSDFVGQYFFADFDPDSPAGLSRNTVGHGVAPAAEFNAKGAALAVLILEQIAYTLMPNLPMDVVEPEECGDG